MPKYGINKATLLGNVGTEPYPIAIGLQYPDQGVAACAFRIATTERVKGRDGQFVDRTDPIAVGRHNIVLWRQKAELAQKFFRIGTGLFIEGRIINWSWDGPDGQKWYKAGIEAETVRMLDGCTESHATAGSGSTASAKPESRPASPADPQVPAHSDEKDDLPF